jgi:hypothetical protein
MPGVVPHLQPQERPNIEECSRDAEDAELHDFLLAAIGFGTCQGLQVCGCLWFGFQLDQQVP